LCEIGSSIDCPFARNEIKSIRIIEIILCIVRFSKIGANYHFFASPQVAPFYTAVNTGFGVKVWPLPLLWYRGGLCRTATFAKPVLPAVFLSLSKFLIQ
jgi:hypothetical protein